MTVETAKSEPEWLGSHALRDGRQVRFRHAARSDAAAVRVAMRSSSDETLRQRFFAAVRDLDDRELERSLQLDPDTGVCVVGELGEGNERRLVCGIRYIRADLRNTAEIALTVHDDFRRQGLAQSLMHLAMEMALHDGVRELVAHVLPTNEAMLTLLARIAPCATRTWDGNLQQVRISLAECVIHPPDSKWRNVRPHE